MHINFNKSGLNKTDADSFIYDVKNIVKKYPLLNTQNIVIEFSNRLRTAAGNVTFKQNKYIVKISTKNVKTFGINAGIGTLRHEIAHIIDFVKNGKFGHGSYFKMICADLKGTMNPIMAGSKYKECATTKYLQTPYKYEYRCKCGLVLKRKRKIKKNLYCVKCHTKVSDMNIIDISKRKNNIWTV